MLLRNKYRRDKKAIALIVSYVILTGIALALSALVYTWTKSRVQKPFPEESCPEDISIILVSAKCPLGNNYSLNITVQNKGLFNVHGYVVKSSDESVGIAGKSSFDLYFFMGNPGDNLVDFTGQDDKALVGNEKNWTLFNKTNKPVKQIELEPFIIREGKRKYCEKSIITQRIDC